MSNLKYVSKFHIYEYETNIPREYYTFDLDDGKDFCYRSRMSFNAFFHSLKDRNRHGEFIFHTNEKVLLEIDARFFGETDINWIVCKNIWEFYQTIGYDYKTKKYLNN